MRIIDCFISIFYLLSVPEYNKRMLKERVGKVKGILSSFSYPYNRRIAGAHGRFTKEDYKEWLQNVEKLEFARALSRLAQLNQSKVYLFWGNSAKRLGGEPLRGICKKLWNLKCAQTPSSISLRRLLISTTSVLVTKRENLGFASNPIVTKRSPM